MKNKLIVSMFCIITGGLFLFNAFSPDEAVSWSERRTLAQAPSISGEFLLSGKAQNELETYMLDQFAFRDAFRGVKAAVDLNLFHKRDNNGIYVIGDRVFKMEYPLNERSVEKLADKMNEIYRMYLTGCHTAVAVIPDKSAFVAEKKGYLSYDYFEMTGLLTSELEAGTIEYIDIMDDLSLNRYYRTDLHWKQEGLGSVLAQLGEVFKTSFPAAGLGTDLKSWEDAGYKVHSYEPFYGAYYGQAALSLKPDTLNYFTSNQINGLSVENLDDRAKEEDQVIYNASKLGSIDSYEVFLSGNSPLITLENPLNDSGRELIVFRDSFGSSIAPFLAEGYSKVTLVDLRFIGYQNIGQFVDFSDQDVLFLLSAGVVNNSDMIRQY